MPWLTLSGPLQFSCAQWVDKTVLSPCMAPISSGEAFFPVWASTCQLNAVTIASSLKGGCSLSHKRAKDGSKSTCVEFGCWKPNTTGIWLVQFMYRLKVTTEKQFIRHESRSPLFVATNFSTNCWKSWTYKHYYCQEMTSCIIGVSCKMAAYRSWLGVRLAVKNELVDTIRVYSWVESKIWGINLKREFSLPVALAHQQCKCHWTDYENQHNNSYL